MAGEIDPIERMMSTLAGVDLDSYGNSGKQPDNGMVQEPETETKDTSPIVEEKPKSQKKTKKATVAERQTPNNTSYSTIIIRKATRDKVRMAKIMYESEVGLKVTLNDFIEMLIEKGLPALSPEACKRFKALNFGKE